MPESSLRAGNLPAWIRRPWVRNSAIGVFLVFLLYTLAGFFLVPYLVEKQLVHYLKEDLGAEASVEQVIINPYTLTLTIDDFSLRQPGKPKFFSFKQFYANFELLSVFHKAWTFQELRLTHPYLKLQISKSGQLNVVELLPPAETPTPNERKGWVPLISHQITISKGEVYFVDRSQPTPFKKYLESIDVNLTKFSTLAEHNVDYSFKAVTKAGETLHMKGDIFTLNPLYAKGHFALIGGKASPLGQYLSDQVAFKISSGRFDTSMDYMLDSREDPLQVTLNNATATLSQLGLRANKGDKEVLTVPKLKISGGQLRWPEKIIGIEQIYMAGTNLRAWLNEQGVLNWQQLLNKKTTEEKASTVNSPAKSWQAAIKTIIIENLSASFQDRTTEPPVTVDISDLALQLTDVSSMPDLASDFDLKFTINEQGLFSAYGNFTALSPTIDANIHLTSLSLLPFQPYVSRFLKMEMTSGHLDAKGNIEYAQNNGTPDFRFNGHLALQQFSAEDTLLGERFLAWDALKADQMLVELFPTRIRIADIKIDAPYGKVVINENQTTNIKEVLSPLTEKKETQPAPKSVPPQVTINSIHAKEAAVIFTDLSLPPEFSSKFSMGIHSLQGEIQNLSSATKKRSSVSLEGTVEPYGVTRVAGEINFFALSRATKFNALFRNVALTALTPYAMKYLGYTIEGGKLSLNLDFQIREGQLEGENEILLENLDLGKKVESPEAIEAPIKLAIALLENPRGIIDVGLPIDGNLNSPQFSYGHLVGKVLVGFIGEVISSPFRFLANLAGAEELDLEFVEFRPASSKLLPPAQEELLQLAEALKNRPKLRLQIQGRYDPITDANFLKKEKFETVVSTRLKQERNISGKKEATFDRQQVLEQLYLEQFSIEALNQKRSQYGLRPAEAGTEPVEEIIPRYLAVEAPPYRKALQEQLIETQTVTNKELHQLGQARAVAIKTYLIDQGGIQEERIEILPVEAAQSVGQDLIRCQFYLNS
ncbi:DUF748 domain-containing protein [Nitrosococcus wardiae]|uniref:DUF748 domain-containing protein n=1 Tax=Nitrosococcus wardiae TaxID=1814290 RepID=A0A4P7C0Z3_9GAMM|nr:DUF748 domain-containing protein [Nitrosococcus wardiae]QBQ55094.1 DUF748 domain-containing protein [Nitrosococcus wardiae]